MATSLPSPICQTYDGITVVRDDLLPGGTKMRYLLPLFGLHDAIVYASPAQGGAQVALAYCASMTGKRAVIFTAKRKQPHFRTIQAVKAGATVRQISPGYLTVVQAKARKYAESIGAYYLPFGADTTAAIEAIAAAAALVRDEQGAFDQVWAAAGSGTLIRGLQLAGLGREYHAVQVGRPPDIGRALLHKHPLAYDQQLTSAAPFPSCPHYDRKAWAFCRQQGRGRVLFWNVLGV